jgi:hypothetical protein
VQKPNNQPLIDYRGNDAEAAFRAALDRIPKEFDVPMVIGGSTSTATQERASILHGKQFCTSQNASAEQAQRAILRRCRRSAVVLAHRGAGSEVPRPGGSYERRHEICGRRLGIGFIAPEVSGGWRR